MKDGFTKKELEEIRRLLPEECANDLHFPDGKVIPDEDNPNYVHIYANGYTVLIIKGRNLWHVMFSTSSSNLIEEPLSDAITNTKIRFMNIIEDIYKEQNK